VKKQREHQHPRVIKALPNRYAVKHLKNP
jgi:hypothetical protein